MKTITKITHPALALFAFAGFALSPQARAVCQEGCLSNFNTVLGDDALLNNTSSWNTAIGSHALMSNTLGSPNTAVGWNALMSNTTGNGNTAIGFQALEKNTTFVASSNTAIGGAALIENTTGANNCAVGDSALFWNTTGVNNIALGTGAGQFLTTGGNNIDIGNAGIAGESNTIRIGLERTQTATYIAGIRQAPLAGGTAVAVGITADGQLGVKASSARFKEAIKPMDKASEAILSLQPVTFRYKKALDPKATPQFGLVAEQVEKVDPDLVAKDEQGKPFTVRYEEVNAMLLNEFLKEHRKVEQQDRKMKEQDATIAQLKSGMEALTATVKTQAAQIQKVIDRIRTQARAPRVVAND